MMAVVVLVVMVTTLKTILKGTTTTSSSSSSPSFLTITITHSPLPPLSHLHKSTCQKVCDNPNEMVAELHTIMAVACNNLQEKGRGDGVIQRQ